jgi:hypothetical protein
MSSTLSKGATRRLGQLGERYARLKSEFRDLGFVCVGSLQSRHLECGKAACRCQRDPATRHGPYHYWTRKVAGKTVAVLIPADDVVLYREWIATNRTLDRVVRQMRQVSARALFLTKAHKVR